MDKEQKKLLLVAVSVGVFLLVTITAALIILTPKVKTEETAFTPARPLTPARIQPANNTNIPPLQPVPDYSQAADINTNMENSEPATTVGNGTYHNTIVLPQIQNPAGVPNPGIAQISPPTPSRTAGNPAPAATPATTTNPAPAVNPAPAATQAPATAPTQTTAPTTASQPAATKPAAATTTPTRTINDYWIQTGAYSAIVRAEDAKEMLASKGFISIIETRVIDGRNLYRVRLGPYTSEREANYWLALVKAIDGFNDSQIRQTTRAQ
jgi:DedD protein